MARYLGKFVLLGLLTVLPARAGAAALLLNEYNGVAPNRLLNAGNSVDPYFGAVMGNGGDWFELVVVADHLDIRGWKVVVADNGGASSATLVFTNNPLWQDLRAGTIITVAEEVADDTSYDPANGDWWINVQSGAGGSGTYITAADFTVSNSDTTVEIRTVDDLPIFGPAGESISDVGVNSEEVFKLEEAPSALIGPTSDGYNDGSSSSFGAPNVFGGGTMTQDFSALRSGQRPEDEDFDGVRDCQDNCGERYNPDQRNTDGDSFGDACDPDQGGEEGPGLPAEGCIAFDIFDPNHVLEVEVNISQANWDQLRHQGRRLLDTFGGDCTSAPPGSPYDWFQADITIDGETRTNVGVRKKGFLGSLDPVRPSLKVRISRYVESQRLFGTDRFTFNNAKQDPGKIKTCLSYQAFRAAGLPAPRCSFAHVKVTTENGTQDLGIYANVEDIESPFLNRNFGNSGGNLYEGSFGSDFRPRSLPIFEKENNEEENDGSDLVALAKVLGQATDEQLVSQLEPLVDVDDFITFWATEGLIGHWDGYAGDVNNYFLYHNLADGKFHFLPWGPDDTWGQGNPLRGEGSVAPLVWARGKLPYRLYQNPPTAALYQQRLQALFDTIWNESALLAEVDRMQALILPYTGDVSAYINPIRQFISGRRAKFAADFAEGPPAWTEPLSDGFCMTQVGDIQLSFSTKWNTVVPTFPTSGIGYDSLTGMLYGIDLSVPVQGLRYVVAGGSDVAALAGRGVIRLIFQLPGLPDIWVIQVSPPPSEIIPGSTLTVDSDLTNVFIVLGDNMQPIILGALADGTLHFDETASTVPGQTISGDLDAKIAQFSPAPGSCAGDCDRDSRITAADLVGANHAARGGEDYNSCEEVDRDENFGVSEPELETAIRMVFGSCPSLPPLVIQP